MRPAGSLLVVAVAMLAGCGGGSPARTTITGDTLSVYTGLPLRGARAAVGRAVLRGEKLALHDAAGHVGDREVSLVALDDTDARTARWAPGQVAANARQAVQNPTTIAYVGDLDSGATAVSVPITNAVGVLQVSPLSGYTGLTQPDDKGEPDKYYPTRRRTFARLVPPGATEARALASWLRALGIGRVGLAYDGLQEGLGQGGELEKGLAGAGVTVADVVRVDPRDGPADVAEDARVLERGALPAVLYAGGSVPAARALLTAVHAALPAAALFATSGVASGALARALPAAVPPLRVTSPLLPVRARPAPARRVSAAYRRLFGVPAPPAALYGYEAMRGVLDAVRRAGPAGNDRASVLGAYFHTTATRSVLGPYSIDPRGDTTATSFGGFSARDGRLTLERVLHPAD